MAGRIELLPLQGRGAVVAEPLLLQTESRKVFMLGNSWMVLSEHAPLKGHLREDPELAGGFISFMALKILRVHQEELENFMKERAVWISSWTWISSSVTGLRISEWMEQLMFADPPLF